MEKLYELNDLRLAEVSLLTGVQEPRKYSTELRYSYFVWYPGDFTFVCPTEILQLNELSEQFREQSVEVVPISEDSPWVHKAWLETPTKHKGLGGTVNQLSLYTQELTSSAPEQLRRMLGLGERSDILVDNSNGDILWKRDAPLDVGRNFEDVLRTVRSLNALQDNPGHYCTVETSQPLPKV